MESNYSNSDENFENKKIISNYEELKNCVNNCKKRDKKIVLTQGSWDLIHIGHARYIKEAKERGDVLIVGVDSDEKVKRRKGPDRPIVPQKERMEMISHLSYVDYVVLKDVNEEKWSLIKLLTPDILIATEGTYDEEQAKRVKEICGDLVILEPRATTSTTAKIKRLQITTAEKVEQTLRPKIIKAIEDTLNSIKK